jgi:hypothetical protein
MKVSKISRKITYLGFATLISALLILSGCGGGQTTVTKTVTEKDPGTTSTITNDPTTSKTSDKPTSNPPTSTTSDKPTSNPPTSQTSEPPVTNEPKHEKTFGPNEIGGLGDTGLVNNVYFTLEDSEIVPAKYGINAASGKRILILEVEVENETNDFISLQPDQNYQLKVDGQLIDLDENFALALQENGKKTLDGNISKGKDLDAYLGYQIPVAWNEIELTICDQPLFVPTAKPLKFKLYNGTGPVNPPTTDPAGDDKFTIGNTAVSNGIEVTLNSVEIAHSLSSIMPGGGTVSTEPGQDIVIMEVTIKNTTNENYMLVEGYSQLSGEYGATFQAYFDDNIVDGVGIVYSIDALGAQYSTYTYNGKRAIQLKDPIGAGKTETGLIGFIHDSNWKKIELHIDTSLPDNDIKNHLVFEIEKK